MTEYVCLVLLSEPGESETAFKSRLTLFWTHLIRNHPDDYERVYSEAVEFDTDGDRIIRQYMIEPEAVDVLSHELATHRIAFAPVDVDDLYSKAEASSSEWFQIEH